MHLTPQVRQFHRIAGESFNPGSVAGAPAGPFGRHLPPDGMHLLIHVLLMVAVVSAVIGLVKTPVREDAV